MDSSRLGKDPNGTDVVFGGARTCLYDAAKIGLLMSNEGKYKNKQIISESWINQSVTPSEKAPYYGYLWWLDYGSEDKNYAATGDGGQLTIVFPDLNLVFLRRQYCNNTQGSDMTWLPGLLKKIPPIISN